MATTAFKEKITKKAFEAKVIGDFGNDKLAASPYDEQIGDTRTKMTLYYLDGTHIGTWCKGEGWIFKKAYEPKTTGKNNFAISRLVKEGAPGEFEALAHKKNGRASCRERV